MQVEINKKSTSNTAVFINKYAHNQLKQNIANIVVFMKMPVNNQNKLFYIL